MLVEMDGDLAHHTPPRQHSHPLQNAHTLRPDLICFLNLSHCQRLFLPASHGPKAYSLEPANRGGLVSR